MFDPADSLKEYETKSQRACETDGCDFDGEVIVTVREYRREVVLDFECPKCGAEVQDIVDNEDLQDFDADYGYDY